MFSCHKLGAGITPQQPGFLQLGPLLPWLNHICRLFLPDGQAAAIWLIHESHCVTEERSFTGEFVTVYANGRDDDARDNLDGSVSFL